MTIAGMPPHDLSGYTDARIAQNLERNLPYVDQWLSLPRHRVFVPPRRFGEIGHDIDGVIVKVTAGVLVSGTNAIVVNAGANDQIALRGLDIDGLGTGLVAVKFLAGKALIVENCQIYGFTQNGIEAALAATASVDVKDTRINNVVGAGIKVHTTAGNVALLADHVAISRVGTNGVEAAGGALGTVSNSTIFAASNAVAATANGATLNVDNTELLSSLVGANATVAGAILELNNNSIYFNNTAIGGAVGSQVLTAANNKLSGNASPGANPSGNVTIK